MSISLLHDFVFDEGSILEVKFNELDKNARKSERFQWYLTLDNRRYDLSFIERVGDTRVLFNRDIGILRFDPTTGYLEAMEGSKTIKVQENDGVISE